MLGLVCFLAAFGTFVLPFVMAMIEMFLAHEREMARLRHKERDDDVS